MCVLTEGKGLYPLEPRTCSWLRFAKHKEQTAAGNQERTKSSCSYSCFRKDTARMATSESDMKAEITFLADFLLHHLSNPGTLSPATNTCMDHEGALAALSLDATAKRNCSALKRRRLPPELHLFSSVALVSTYCLLQHSQTSRKSKGCAKPPGGGGAGGKLGGISMPSRFLSAGWCHGTQEGDLRC